MFSINKNIHNCKVKTFNAERMESDRMFNTNNLICPVWNGQDDYGREVSQDTRMLLTYGCNHADDLVKVENYLNPGQLSNWNLNAYGIDGTDLYTNKNNPNMTFTQKWEQMTAENERRRRRR